MKIFRGPPFGGACSDFDPDFEHCNMFGHFRPSWSLLLPSLNSGKINNFIKIKYLTESQWGCGFSSKLVHRIIFYKA